MKSSFVLIGRWKTLWHAIQSRMTSFCFFKRVKSDRFWFSCLCSRSSFSFCGRTLLSRCLPCQIPYPYGWVSVLLCDMSRKCLPCLFGFDSDLELGGPFQTSSWRRSHFWRLHGSALPLCHAILWRWKYTLTYFRSVLWSVHPSCSIYQREIKWLGSFSGWIGARCSSGLVLSFLQALYLALPPETLSCPKPDDRKWSD